MKKVTWEKIHKDLKTRSPGIAKLITHWRPHDFATILLYLKDGSKATYNYDTKSITILEDKWTH